MGMIEEKTIEQAISKMTTGQSEVSNLSPTEVEEIMNSHFENSTPSSLEIQNKNYPLNRAQRRAAEKATRRQKQKKKRMYIDSIKEAAEKLAYINMIEKIRELNEKIKEEGEKENEAAN
jgi:hypothetical protein